MKKIMVICGTGVATSTIAASRIRKWLESKAYRDVEVLQSRVMDQLDKLDSYDVVVSTTTLSAKGNAIVLNGIPLISGVGIDELYQKLEEALR